MFSQLSEGAESPFTSLDVYQRPGEKRVQRYHDRQTPPKRCLSSCDGEAFLCSPASPRTSGVSSGEALAHSADVETVWQDVFNLDAGTAGQEYYQGLLGEGQADDMEAVSIKSGEGPLPNAPWGPMPPLVPLVCIDRVLRGRGHALCILTGLNCSTCCRSRGAETQQGTGLI